MGTDTTTVHTLWDRKWHWSGEREFLQQTCERVLYAPAEIVALFPRGDSAMEQR